MKPCSSNRKLIAWLALGALDAAQERGIRVHLENCEGCRRYLEEISTVTAKLSATEARADIQASAAFHRRVAEALRAEEAGRKGLKAQIRAQLLSWRVALPATAAALVMITAMGLLLRHRALPSPGP